MQFLSSLKERGSAMIQAMVVSGVVLGLSAYMLNNHDQQEKVRYTTVARTQKTVFTRELSEALADHETCFNTLNSVPTLSNGMDLPRISSKTNESMYEIGSEFAHEKITRLKLYSFNPSGGMRYNAAQLHITLQSTKTSADGGYGGRDITYTIPIFLISENNKVSHCTADPTGGVKAAYKKACEEFEGVFNESVGACVNLHGNNGSVLNRIRSKLCSSSGAACQHPFAGVSCQGVDRRGQAWNNWVATSLGVAPAMSCVCLPVACPNPASYCAGQDLGTDHCQAECGVGTMDCSCNWVTGAWSACVSGNQTRTVDPFKDNGQPADPAFCTGSKPDVTQPCSTPPPPANFNWSQGGFGSCSNSCGPGSQSQTVVCVNNGGNTMPDSKCDAASRPASSKPCNGTSCGFGWKPDSWGACSSSVCGSAGTQTRSVICEDKNTFTATADSNCDASSKPTTSQPCGSTCGFGWQSDNWGACAPACSPGDSGTQTRNVWCQNTTTNVQEPNESKCTDPKPNLTQSCTSMTDTAFNWDIGAAGACTAIDCNVGSAGTQTRDVSCKGSCTNSVVDDSKCTGTRPEVSLSCTATCAYEWRLSSTPGPCSNSCGPGSTSRDAHCFNVATNAQVSDGLCPSGTKPASTEACVGTSCSNCVGKSMSWTVGADSCDAVATDASHGMQSLASDTGAPSLGSAKFLCTNGTWGAATESSCENSSCFTVSCFVAGTKVTMANGMLKNIEDVKMGEHVRTYDELLGRITTSPVKETFHHDEKLSELYEFTFSNSQNVTSNEVHLFYSVDDRNYVSAKEIYQRWSNGHPMKLLTEDKKVVSVSTIKQSFDVVRLYNIHVVGSYDTLLNESQFGHNYFANSVLVHNEKSLETLESYEQSPMPNCCPASNLVRQDSYPRHIKCCGVKSAYNACVNAL